MSLKQASSTTGLLPYVGSGTTRFHAQVSSKKHGICIRFIVDLSEIRAKEKYVGQVEPGTVVDGKDVSGSCTWVQLLCFVGRQGDHNSYFGAFTFWNGDCWTLFRTCGDLTAACKAARHSPHTQEVTGARTTAAPTRIAKPGK